MSGDGLEPAFGLMHPESVEPIGILPAPGTPGTGRRRGLEKLGPGPPMVPKGPPVASGLQGDHA